MARGLLITELESEWQALPRNWYAIYQWKRTSRGGYLEWIAERIFKEFSQIQLVTDGLRSRTFQVADHRGQISLNTEIEQITEKRLVRAMFNSRSIPLLGTVINYEVPLKDTDEAAHGDTITVLVNKESIKVRLEGIDASESKQSFGTQSKQALSEMVFGKQVTIKKTGDDRYGRTLGVVMFGNVDANA